MSKNPFPVILVFSILYMTSCVFCTRTDCKDKHPITEALSNPRSLVDKYLDRYVPSFGTESLRNRRDHREKLLTIVSDEAEKNYALIADSLNRGNKRTGNQQSGYTPNGGMKNEGGYGGGGGGYGESGGGGYGGNGGGGYGGNGGGGGYGDGGSYPEPSPGYGGYDDPMIGHGNPSGGKGHKGGGAAGGYGSGEEEFGTGYAENPEPGVPESPG